MLDLISTKFSARNIPDRDCRLRRAWEISIWATIILIEESDIDCRISCDVSAELEYWDCFTFAGELVVVQGALVGERGVEGGEQVGFISLSDSESNCQYILILLDAPLSDKNTVHDYQVTCEGEAVSIF